MKKLKLLIVALALLGGVNSVFADDVFKDVTSTYLTNADFEGTYSVKSGTGVSTDRAIYQPEGWTVSYSNGQVNDCSALNSSCRQWDFFKNYNKLSTGGNNTYWIRLHKDKSNQQLELSQTVNLPLGSYKLSAAYLKAESGGDGYIFVNSTTQNGTSNNTWITVSIDFTSNGSSTTKLGCRAVHTNSYNKIYAFDNFKLEWNLTASLQSLLNKANDFYTAQNDESYSVLKGVIDATNVLSTDAGNLETQYNTLAEALDLAQNHRKPWLAAKTAAETAIANTTEYGNVVGVEKTSLQTAIEASEPSDADGYDDAISDLETKTSNFTTAKANYDALVSEIAYAQTIGMTEEDASAYAATSTSTAASVLTSTQNLKVAEYNLINTNYPNDVTKLLGTWDKGNYETANSQGYNSGSYFNKWNATSMDMSSSAAVTLPSGVYALKVAGRGNSTMSLSVQVGDATAVSTPFLMISDTGRGIDTNGETNFSDEGTYNNNNNGYGWQYRYITFIVPEGGSEVTITISGHINNSWQSFYAPVLLANDATFLPMCLAELGEAMTAATNAVNEESTLMTTIAQTADPSAATVKYQTVVGGSEGAALAAAVTAAGEVDQTSITEVQSTIIALNEATEAYNAAKPAYERAAMIIAVASNYNVNVSYLSTLVSNTNSTATQVATAANNIITLMVPAALNSSTASKTFGFEENEYAPYNNVEGMQMIATGTAMASAPANYTNEQIYAPLAAIGNYEWTPNTTEVNAIYDGTLANAPIQATSENVVLPGWVTKSGSLRQTFSGTGEDGKACLDDADDGVGLFVHPGTYVYGGTTGYTMPLKANVTYLARAKYCSWERNSNNNFTLTIKNGNTQVATKSYGANKTACTVEGALKEVILYFTPAEDADYTLTIDTDGNTFMTDIYIMKAVEIEISETDDSAPEPNKYAIVTLNRTLSASYWNTFSVPFDMAIPEGWEVKEFDSAADNVINFKDAESIVAGNPYLVKPNSDVVNPTYNGVVVVNTEGKTIGDEGGCQFAAQIYNKSLPTDGTIAYLSTNGSVKKLASNGSIKGLRAYFIIPAGSTARIAFTDGSQTGIEDSFVETENDNRVYDLQGRQVKAVKKGIYVVNGKKVIK